MSVIAFAITSEKTVACIVSYTKYAVRNLVLLTLTLFYLFC